MVLQTHITPASLGFEGREDQRLNEHRQEASESAQSGQERWGLAGQEWAPGAQTSLGQVISFPGCSLPSPASSPVEGCVSAGLHCDPGVSSSEGGNLGCLSVLLNPSPTLMPNRVCQNKPHLKPPPSSLWARSPECLQLLEPALRNVC